MKTTESFWDAAGTEDWTDDDGEVRMMNEAEIASMTPFADLPQSLKTSLLHWNTATFVPALAKDTVDVSLSADVIEKFEAMGEGWQLKVDEALREWLEEHPAT